MVFHKFSNYELAFQRSPQELMFILPAIWSRQFSTWGSGRRRIWKGLGEGAGNEGAVALIPQACIPVAVWEKSETRVLKLCSPSSFKHMCSLLAKLESQIKEGRWPHLQITTQDPRTWKQPFIRTNTRVWKRERGVGGRGREWGLHQMSGMEARKLPPALKHLLFKGEHIYHILKKKNQKQVFQANQLKTQQKLPHKSKRVRREFNFPFSIQKSGCKCDLFCCSRWCWVLAAQLWVSRPPDRKGWERPVSCRQGSAPVYLAGWQTCSPPSMPPQNLGTCGAENRSP